MSPEDVSPIEITDFGSLQRAMLEGPPETKPIWRGHDDFAWDLRPEVFRPKQDGSRYHENSLLRHFIARAESRHPRCPPAEDSLGWVILARHYGLPTRLTDWSLSPLVALWFAVRRDDRDGCLWRIDEGLLNFQTTGQRGLKPHDDPVVTEAIKPAFGILRAQLPLPGGLLNLPSCIAIGPRELDGRVLAQQGTFLIHTDASDLAELQYAAPQGHTPQPWRRAFRVPAAAKSNLRFMLEQLAISRATLFPDLSSLAQSIKEGGMLGV